MCNLAKHIFHNKCQTIGVFITTNEKFINIISTIVTTRLTNQKKPNLAVVTSIANNLKQI